MTVTHQGGFKQLSNTVIYNLGFLLNINSRPEMNVAQSDQAEPDALNSDVLKNDETIDRDNELRDGEQIHLHYCR